MRRLTTNTQTLKGRSRALLAAALLTAFCAGQGYASNVTTASDRTLSNTERQRAINDLYRDTSPDADAALLKIATSADEHEYLRSSALAVLGVRKPKEAVEPLMGLLKKTDEHWMVRTGAAMALARMKVAAAIPITEAEAENSNAYIRAAMLSALAEHGEIAGDSIDLFIKLLETDPDSKVRRRAAEGMWKLGTKAWPAIPALQKALQDKDPQVGIWAVFSLRYLKIPQNANLDGYTTALAEAVRASPKADDRKDVIIRVGELGPAAAGAVPTLIESLKSSDQQEVVEAARSLGKIGAPAGVKPLLETLKHKYDVARATAATALGKLEAAEAVEPLAALLKDESTLVQTAARQALKNIGTDDALKYAE